MGSRTAYAIRLAGAECELWHTGAALRFIGVTLPPTELLRLAAVTYGNIVVPDSSSGTSTVVKIVVPIVVSFPVSVWHQYS